MGKFTTLIFALFSTQVISKDFYFAPNSILDNQVEPQPGSISMSLSTISMNNIL